MVSRPTLKRAGEQRRFIDSGGLRPEAIVPGVADPAAPLTSEQVSEGVARLGQLRDLGTITDKTCRAQQALLIARRR